MRKILYYVFALASCTHQAQPGIESIEPGAYQLGAYLPLLQGKNVGLCVNHSSVIGGKHLTDSLISHGVAVEKVFTPEHGFTGTTSDGIAITYEKDQAPFELVSLYGKNKKPNRDQMNGIEIMVFDIQDVGTRFYTYISTMHYVMEACAENQIPLVILDRPNPNGSYVDGPVLDTTYRSFVGMHPIPIVHGLTVGELAKMINGERWLTNSAQCDLTIIPMKNWDHATPYSLPIRPSPNLPNDLSISLYPSLCLFEGTIVSVGRGTNYAFQQIGHPEYPDTSYSFTPTSIEGAKWPPHQNVKCYGINWINTSPSYELSLAPLIDAYKKMNREDFFNDYFKKLAGTDELEHQIRSGMSEEDIRASWQKDLDEYREKRLNYLIYN